MPTRSNREIWYALTAILFITAAYVFVLIIYREIPEIWSYAGLTSGDYGTVTDVEPFYMCGAEALAHAVGQRPKATRSSSDDYQFIKGIGSEELFSMEKAFFNGTQHGMVNGFVATTPTP